MQIAIQILPTRSTDMHKRLSAFQFQEQISQAASCRETMHRRWPALPRGKARKFMVGDEVDNNIYAEDESKRQAEKEDIRTVARQA